MLSLDTQRYTMIGNLLSSEYGFKFYKMPDNCKLEPHAGPLLGGIKVNFTFLAPYFKNFDPLDRESCRKGT